MTPLFILIVLGIGAFIVHIIDEKELSDTRKEISLLQEKIRIMKAVKEDMDKNEWKLVERD